MKKSLFIMICASLMMLVSSSCTRTEESMSQIQNEDKELIALKNQLEELNSTLPDRVESTKAAWWKYLVVAAADAGGFFLAGASGPSAVSAACAVSTLAWSVVKEDMKTATRSFGESDQVSLRDPEIALSKVNGEGLLHNKIIISMYNDFGEDLFSMKEDDLLPEVTDRVSQETGEVVSDDVLLTAKQREVVSKTVRAYDESDTVDEFIEKLSLSAPEKASLLELVNVILEGFDKIDPIKDDGKYNDAVMDLVSGADISRESKETLNSTTSVANASSRLWKMD